MNVEISKGYRISKGGRWGWKVEGENCKLLKLKKGKRLVILSL